MQEFKDDYPENTPPKTVWTCRDWYFDEPTKLTKRDVEETECSTCSDRAECKGPVEYQLKEVDDA